MSTLGKGRAEAVYSRGVKAITGDYWEVWPLAFAANLLHEQATRERVVLPAALRADRLVKARAKELTANSAVMVLPSGALAYWASNQELPPLGPIVRVFADHSIMYVTATE